MAATETIFFFQAEDGIRDTSVTGVQTCALPICCPKSWKAGHKTLIGQQKGPALRRALVLVDGSLLLDRRVVAVLPDVDVVDRLLDVALLVEFEHADRSEERRVGKEGRCGLSGVV